MYTVYIQCIFGILHTISLIIFYTVRWFNFEMETNLLGIMSLKSGIWYKFETWNKFIYLSYTLKKVFPRNTGGLQLMTATELSSSTSKEDSC